MFNENTAENVAKIQLPVKLEVLAIHNIPDTFDFEHFSKFLQVSNLNANFSTAEKRNMKIIRTTFLSFSQK